MKLIYFKQAGSWCGRTKYMRGQDYIKAGFGFFSNYVNMANICWLYKINFD